jgi:hypothetical protein
LFEIGDVESGLGFWLDNTSKIQNPSAQTVLSMVPLSPHCSNHTDSTKIQVIIYL